MFSFLVGKPSFDEATRAKIDPISTMFGSVLNMVSSIVYSKESDIDTEPDGTLRPMITDGYLMYNVFSFLHIAYFWRMSILNRRLKYLTSVYCRSRTVEKERMKEITCLEFYRQVMITTPQDYVDRNVGSMNLQDASRFMGEFFLSIRKFAHLISSIVIKESGDCAIEKLPEYSILLRFIDEARYDRITRHGENDKLEFTNITRPELKIRSTSDYPIEEDCTYDIEYGFDILKMPLLRTVNMEGVRFCSSDVPNERIPLSFVTGPHGADKLDSIRFHRCEMEFSHQELIRKIPRTRSSPTSHEVKLDSLGRRVTSIDVSASSVHNINDFIMCLINDFPLLETINLSRMEHLTNTHVWSLLSRMKNLKHLNVSFCTSLSSSLFDRAYWESVTMCNDKAPDYCEPRYKSLLSLDYRHSFGCVSPWCEHKEHVPELTTLNISGTHTVNIGKMLSASDYGAVRAWTPSRVQKLILRRTTLTNNAITAICISLKNTLTYLDISNPNDPGLVTDILISSISKHAPNIEELILDNCPKLCNLFACHLNQNTKKLKTLSVKNNPNITANIFPILMTGKTAERFDLAGRCRDIENEVKLLDIEKKKGIHIELTENQHESLVTDHTLGIDGKIKEILEEVMMLCKLRKLDFRGCMEINHVEMDSIRKIELYKSIEFLYSSDNLL